MIYTSMVPFADILSFVSAACPKISWSGKTSDADSQKVLKILRDEELVEGIAHGLFKIDCAYEAQTNEAYQKLDVAHKNRAKSREELVRKYFG